MSYSCIVPNCKIRDSTGKKKFNFKFPRDKTQLELWKQNLVFVDFENLNLVKFYICYWNFHLIHILINLKDKARICADHFDKTLIVKSYKNNSLADGALPTIFSCGTDIKDYLRCCRFCLKCLTDAEECREVDDEVRDNYRLLTDNEVG